jgi:hypothetical protein
MNAGGKSRAGLQEIKGNRGPKKGCTDSVVKEDLNINDPTVDMTKDRNG